MKVSLSLASLKQDMAWSAAEILRSMIGLTVFDVMKCHKHVCFVFFKVSVNAYQCLIFIAICVESCKLCKFADICDI